MKHLLLPLLVLIACAGCDRLKAKSAASSSSASSNSDSDTPTKETQSLAEARSGFKTNLLRKMQAGKPVDQPPANLFTIVQYDSAVGKLPAYLTPDPGDGARHPAIVWITGGDCNTIGDVWTKTDKENDQTASDYREAGIVMMYPSLRGGNQNPGFEEGFFGEVDDVIAAADFLAKQPYVDPNRIYLGGHSTGGTLALLVSEYSDRFRAVFAFGPVNEISRYDRMFALPFDKTNKREFELRSPIRWLHSIKKPTFVFEGRQRPSNVADVSAMKNSNPTTPIQFLVIWPSDHFSVLEPTNHLIAQKILQDTGPQTNITLTEKEVVDQFH